MKFRPWQLRTLMNLFPPLLFNRVILKRVSPDYREMDVKIRRTLLNKNFERSIFGGSIFSAADPFYAIMYWQHFLHGGTRTQAWLKSAQIDYLKPALSHLWLRFRLTEADLQEAAAALKAEGRFQKWHEIQAVNAQGEVCAQIRTLVYLRLPREKEGDKAAI